MSFPQEVGGAAADVEVDENVHAEMRDGTLLRADVYRPKGRGALPVLVCRTPYGKRGEAFGAPYVATARGLAARGYTVVVQDSRGRYASGGNYRWLYGDDAAADHHRDGYDTTEWAASIAGSNGQVGTWGNSYDGYTSLRTAGAAPPSLTAAFASGVASRLHDETFGIFKPVYLPWMNGMAADLRDRSGKYGSFDRQRAEREWANSREKWLWTMPYDAIPDGAFAELTEPLKQFLRVQENDPWALPKTQPNITVPVCHLTGWWDYVVGGTVSHYVGLYEQSPAPLRDQHRLVIGPWSHRTGATASGDGVVDYGPAERVYYHDEIADWYDYAIKGVDRGGFAEGVVKLFILNENSWRHYESWPVPDSAESRLYLHSNGGANTRFGDGRMSISEPAHQPPSQYIYDPNDPLMSLSTWASRAIDQSVNDFRQDVLVYVTDPLSQPQLLVGEVSCTLWVSSDAPETDFTAKLIEVRPDGMCIELSTGIRRCKLSSDPEKVTIKLGPVGVLFQPGSRIRLDISSSDFPNFDRNHNTGADFWSDSELRPARQTVYNDPQYPSHLVLPFAPTDKSPAVN